MGGDTASRLGIDEKWSKRPKGDDQRCRGPTDMALYE